MRKVLIVALICLFVGALLLGIGWMLLQKNPQDVNTVKDTVKVYHVSELPKEINITTMDSRVEILPIEGNEWRVECRDTEDLYHTVEVADGVLTVKQIGTARKWFEYIGILDGFQTLSVTVYLPQGEYQSLNIHSVSGSIKVQESFAFENASLKNTSGSITCAARITDVLSVKNTSGSITVTGGVGGELKVTNGSGSIEIKDATPTNTEIKNTSGSIALHNVVCQEACRIENTSGSIKLERCDAKSFDLKTVSGGIRGSILSGKTFDCRSTSGGVHVPENSEGGTFKARSTSGGIRITLAE